MLNFNLVSRITLFVYTFIYLIFPNIAISQNTKIDIRKNLENALNNRDLKLIKENYKDKEGLVIIKKFSNFIEEFPKAKWYIKNTKKINSDENVFDIKIIGEKKINESIFFLESNFSYSFILKDGKIKKGLIRNHLTTIRNDKNIVDIIFKIPDKVLTSTIYDIDIILSEPLGEKIIAGGIKAHQEDSYIKQEISLEPLVAGGIFRRTRAPAKPGLQIWSGVIAHPKGIISFTKTVDIVEKL